MNQIDNNKRLLANNKILSFIILLFAFFLLISLLSFDSGDYGNYKYPQNEKIKNFCGYLGAMVSSILYEWLGIISYLLPFFIILISFFYYKNLIFSLYNWLFIYIIVFSWLSTFVSLTQSKEFKSFYMPSRGGILGLFFSSILEKFAGRASSIAIMVIFLSLMIYVTFYFWELKISNQLKGENIEEKK